MYQVKFCMNLKELQEFIHSINIAKKTIIGFTESSGGYTVIYSR